MPFAKIWSLFNRRPTNGDVALSLRLHRWTLVLALAAQAASGSSPALATSPAVEMRRARNDARHVVAPSDQGELALAVDPRLQLDLVTLLRQARAQEAGAVAIDVRSGRVLAWASVDSAGRDLVAVPYAPPASLVKVVAATALMEKAHVPLSARQCYVGGRRSARVEDLRSSGSGDAVRCETLETALGYSRNLVIGGLAARHLRAEDLEATANALGLKGAVPIDVRTWSGEIDVPRDEAGIARSAAGFGSGRVSVLGAAYMMTVIARAGQRPALFLLDHRTGVEKDSTISGAGSPRVMSASTAAALTRMLEVTVREGTCARVFRDSHGRPHFGRMRIAGKTGTLARGNPTRLFSWFAGFAPSNRPEIAVAVMLANEVRWWQKANQIGRDILRAHFSRKRTSQVSHPLHRSR